MLRTDYSRFYPVTGAALNRTNEAVNSGEGGSGGGTPKYIEGVITEDELLAIDGPATGYVDVSRLFTSIVDNIVVALPFTVTDIEIPGTSAKYVYLVGANVADSVYTLWLRQISGGAWIGDWVSTPMVSGTPTLDEVLTAGAFSTQSMGVGSLQAETVRTSGVEYRIALEGDALNFYGTDELPSDGVKLRAPNTTPNIWVELPSTSGVLALQSDIPNIPTPPATGSYTLQSVDGVLSWIETVV